VVEGPAHADEPVPENEPVATPPEPDGGPSRNPDVEDSLDDDEFQDQLENLSDELLEHDSSDEADDDGEPGDSPDDPDDNGTQEG
jgi:hypothetical protein